MVDRINTSEEDNAGKDFMLEKCCFGLSVFVVDTVDRSDLSKQGVDKRVFIIFQKDIHSDSLTVQSINQRLERYRSLRILSKKPICLWCD